MNSDVEDIKSRLNIVDILGGYIKLEKAGSNFRALCPFHNEKTPSFMVSEEKQFWHCFGCQKSGDIFNFVMEMEALDFREALNILAERAGVKLKKYNPQEVGDKDKTLEILELATKFYEKQLWDGAGKEKILNYLKERGLKDEAIKEFRLGYAPNGWRNLLTFLNGRGYKDAETLKTGLIIKKDTTNQKLQAHSQYYDRFRDRIIFPVADVMGKIVGFSARVAPGGDETQAKYVNTPETSVYHKSKILYGINKAKQEMKNKDFVLLVEGNMDVIAAWQAGIKNTVAVSGTALTLEQVDIIKRYTHKVKMFFDMDSAGVQATKKSVKICFEKDLSVNVVELPEGKDAADLAAKDPARLVKSVGEAMEAMEYFLKKSFAKHDKNKAEGKKNIAEEILGMLAGLSNPIEASHWVKRLAELLSVQEKMLTDMLKKATLKNRIEKNTSNYAEHDAFILTKKTEVLLRELAGLMLVYGSVWKKIAEKNRGEKCLEQNPFLKKIISQGEAAGYDFDKFRGLLGGREEIAEAEKLFFGKKYRLGLNNDLEEVVSENPIKEAEEILIRVKNEDKKEELEKISKDLKNAEARQDKEAAAFLRSQFQKISGELM